MPWSICYPTSKGEKVKWWSRTLACLPYIISLHDTWKYWEAAYCLYPFSGRVLDIRILPGF
ncbi:hypothetical protein RHGRI_023568 [Rhododendron griersonianum]|uniref:Protein TIC 20 n=1 Tax=Rhododendron griersonianum TaxID=479676 RepID=A0AAV6J7D3_9ERIC|nr:hypothetical protein RHGRI_023568 [Rhododendron griersonianum]